MRHAFLVNPTAGPRDGARELAKQVAGVFPPGDAEIFFTAKAGDARLWTTEIAGTGEPVRFYACGGDGTLNEVVNGAAGRPNAAVTHVPLGTGNDFLRIFGPDARQRFTDLAALREGQQRELDLMDCNGHLGLDVICVGLDARVAAQVHKFKRLPLVGNKGAYILSLMDSVARGITKPMDIAMGPIRRSGPTTLMCVCNGRYYGGGFCPAPEAMPDDGVLDMLCIGDISTLQLAQNVGKYAAGRYKECPPGFITAWKGQEVTITCPTEVPAVIDGEVLRDTSFTVKLSDKKVNFFFPADVDYRT